MKYIQFTKAFILIICFSIGLFSCKKDSNNVGIRSFNYYGCDKTKSTESMDEYGGCVNFQLDKGSLFIKRENVYLNCGADSLSVDFSISGNKIDIYEGFKTYRATFCNCSRTYDYTIGTLSGQHYQVVLHTPINTAISFDLDDSKPAEKICN